MKKIGVLFCGLLFVLIAFSCSTTGTVWDDSVAPEESAKIAFYNFDPTSYNQIRVEKFRFVTIPAGLAEFSGDVAWSSNAGYVRYYFNSKDAVFSCKLEGGKEYWAIAGYQYDEKNEARIWGIFLYNDAIKVRIGFPGEDKLVGFIPFNPPVISD
jgi:hypothetical protein